MPLTKRKLRPTRQALLVVLLLSTGSFATSAARAVDPGPTRPGQWLAGDLHVHTIWGHDTCITPQVAWDYTVASFGARRPCRDAYVWGYSIPERLQDAAERGLDYLAITDHNNVMSLSDPAYTSYQGPLTLIPAYENSLAGHVQMLGANACYNNAGPVTSTVVECNKLVTDQSVSGMNTLASALRSNGGVFQVNHPSDRNWVSKFGTSVLPDTIEVWNIGAWIYQHPNLASNDNDYSLSYWDSFLAKGYRIGATGGSDSHWRATGQFQGLGEPTTWVFSADRSVAGILAAMKAGRTTISHEVPARHGTRLFFEADSNNDGTFESMVGDQVPPSSNFRVRVQDAVPGSILRIVTEKGYTEIPLVLPVQEFRTDGATFVRVEVRLPDVQDQRIAACDPIAKDIEAESGNKYEITECRNRLVMQALSSPIYLS